MFDFVNWLSTKAPAEASVLAGDPFLDSLWRKRTPLSDYCFVSSGFFAFS